MKAYARNYICKIVATLGPLGYYPAPGTLGSCVGLALMYILAPILHAHIFVGLCVLGLIVTGAYYIIDHASVLSAEYDPQEIILDEVIGCCIAFFGIIWHWWAVLICFGLFRFFDISKCLGGAYLEKRYSGAWGIMLDDIYAGLLANIVTRVIIYSVSS